MRPWRHILHWTSCLLFYKNLFSKWRGKLDKSNYVHFYCTLTMDTLKNKLDLNLVYVKSLQFRRKKYVSGSLFNPMRCCTAHHF